MRIRSNLFRHSRESGNPGGLRACLRRRLDPRFRGDDEGFTLVELMVVIVILGLLATIVLINVMPATDRAKLTAAHTSVKQLEQAIDVYTLDVGHLPTRQEGLQALVTSRILRRLDPDPWGNAFVYKIPGRNGRPYDVLSLGADGREGGTEDNADIYP
jgi:general secretion pathway protein G